MDISTNGREGNGSIHNTWQTDQWSRGYCALDIFHGLPFTG